MAGSATPSLTGLLPPNRLLKQRYRILKQFGTGGFGAVYKAEDTQLGNRFVAVKEMSQGGLSQQEVAEAVDTFKREALMLAGLHHQNLPSVHEHFEEAGRWYLVMDFIEGETLEDYVDKKGGKLPLQEVLDIGIQLCTVLGYLHTHQPPIIFRDLKPSNIMRTVNGSLYLIDFGIARHFKPGKGKDTRIIGTPGYAAPEQYGKAQTTPRSDIYSLGAVLHQLLTGDDPSLAPFNFAPIEPQVQAIPNDLKTLLMQMVEITSDKRPASMAVIKQELQRIVYQLQSPSQPPQPTDLHTLYREGLKAQSQDDFAQAVLLWQQILDRDPHFQQDTFLPQMIELLRQRARQAAERGEWQEAVTTWKKLLELKPKDSQAQEYLPLAEQNQKYVWMYQSAQQCVSDGNLSGAKRLLTNIWQAAPYYGDPAGLGKKVRLQTPPRYEEARDSEKKIQEKKRSREEHRQSVENFYKAVGLSPKGIGAIIFCLVAGVGSTIGILTQSWMWAIVTVVVVTLLAYVFVSHRAINLLTLICTVLIGGAIACGLAWYTSLLPYSQPLRSLGNPDQTFWIGRQINYGLIVGIILSLPILAIIFLRDSIDDDMGCFLGIITFIGCLLVAVSLAGFGYGFGAGWGYSLIGTGVGVVSGIGLIASLVILRRANRRKDKN